MDCRPENLDFLDRAPFRFVNEGEMPVSAERLFEVLADASTWPKWFDDMREARWTSPAPYGVGSTRYVRLTTTAVDERILAFEPGRRFAFRLESIGLPLVRAMVEDYAVESLGATRSKLHWVAAYEPTTLARAVHPVVRAVFGRQFRRTVAGLQTYLTAKG